MHQSVDQATVIQYMLRSAEYWNKINDALFNIMEKVRNRSKFLTIGKPDRNTIGL